MFYQNRGMYLESLINYTIEKYNEDQKAIIFKTRPQILKFYYNDSLLTFATVDYHGIYQGRFICFDAKTTNKSYLPWTNIKSHQWNFLSIVTEFNGISFLIIYFESINLYFLVTLKVLKTLHEKNGRITIDWVKKNGYQIELKYPFVLDFLSVIKIN